MQDVRGDGARALHPKPHPNPKPKPNLNPDPDPDPDPNPNPDPNPSPHQVDGRKAKICVVCARVTVLV